MTVSVAINNLQITISQVLNHVGNNATDGGRNAILVVRSIPLDKHYLRTHVA